MKKVSLWIRGNSCIRTVGQYIPIEPMMIHKHKRNTLPLGINLGIHWEFSSRNISKNLRSCFQGTKTTCSQVTKTPG